MTAELRGITWDHPRGFDSVRGASAHWAAAHPDVRVTWEARSLQGFADEPLEALAARYDLLVIDHPHIPEAHRDGYLLPLDGAGHDSELADLAAHSIGQSHVSYRHGGRQYGLALDAAAQVAVHRPDLLPEPPATWEGVLELAEAGRVLWPAKPVDAISSFLTLTAQRGHRLEAGAPFMDTDAALEALDLMLRLATRVPRECLAENPIETAERLSRSDRWWYAPLAFGYTNYSRDGFRPHRLRYVDIPADASGSVAGSCLGGAGIAVSASTRHPGAATALAFWLAGPVPQAACYFAAGGQPAHAAAWDDDVCNEATLGFFRNTRATLDASSLRPRDTGWLAVQDEAGSLLNRCLRGELDPRATVDAVRASYERSMAGVVAR